MSKYVIDGGTLKSIADAIRAKTGDGGTLTPGDMPEAIESISGGGGGEPTAPAGDVMFIDCDGTIRYSYTAEEFAALAAMPDNPTHDRLTAQGWNWSLADAKRYVAKYGRLVIGQMYITDDGATRLYIHIATSGRMTVPLYWSQTVADGVSIDWGDGSAVSTASDTGNNNTTHTYATPGDYVITLTPTDGCTLGLGAGNNSYCVMGSTANTGMVYCNMLKKAEIGNGVTSIGNNAFYYCCSLSQVTIPDSVTSIESFAFSRCYSLSQVTIPDSVTSIDYGAFSRCQSLSQVTIPDGVTSIGYSEFSNCYGVAEYHLLPTTPPTLANKNAFTGIPSDCIIYVPQGSLEAYQTATNWSNYASQMQEE